MQIMTAKTMTLQTLYIYAVLIVLFTQYFNIFLHAWHFLGVKFFP